jgi:predicted LPLAT superfamily acyltransferase
VRAPDPDARGALARAVERHDAAVGAVAYVVLGEGFQAAVLRGAVTSVMLLSRPSHTTKVFATIADAAAWLERRRARPLAERAEDLIAGIERFCAG